MVAASLLSFLLLQAPPPPTAAVMVVAPEGPPNHPELSWVAEAVADGLPGALAFLGVPVVDRVDRLSAQEDLEIPRVALTRATSIRIAEAVGAARLVFGTYSVEDAILKLSLRVLDVERGTLSSPFIASGPLQEVAESIDSLAWDVALSGPSPPGLTREELRHRRRPVPFEALKAYAQGLAASEGPAQVKLLTRALNLHPVFDDARLALGRLQIEIREFAAAHETLSRMPAGSPRARAASFLQGITLLELGRYREAGALYARLVEEDASAAVLNNQAVALLRAGAGGTRASAVLRRAVEKDPTSKDLAFNMGWALLAEGEGDAAAFWLRGVVREEPRDTHGQVVLSWALRKAGRIEEAEHEWKAVATLTPSYEALLMPDLSRRFERILASESRVPLDREARSDVLVAASLMTDSERLARAGDSEGAMRNLTRAANLDPHEPRIHRLLAQTHRARGELDRAAAELRMSLWSREDPEVRLELAEVLKVAGRSAEARAEAEKVLKAEPGNAAARRLVEKP